MLQVDRGNFVDHNSYTDAPQGIGYSVTISAPHMVYKNSIILCIFAVKIVFQHAHALEILSDHLSEGKRALDVGSGSGYLTACMAIMVGASGKAVGIDHIPELVNKSMDNIRKDHKLANLMLSGQLSLVTGDGRKGRV